MHYFLAMLEAWQWKWKCHDLSYALAFPAMTCQNVYYCESEATFDAKSITASNNRSQRKMSVKYHELYPDLGLRGPASVTMSHCGLSV